MKLITADFETFYGTGYTLSGKGMTTEKYIHDERFKVHGAGIKVGSNPSRWVTGDKLASLFERIDWSDVALVGHNLQFDASILAWHYGHIAKLYLDTLGMSRALLGQHTARHGLDYVAPLVVTHDGMPLHKMDGLAQARNFRDLSAEQERILADYTVKPPHYNPRTQQWEAGDAELTYELLRRFMPLMPKPEIHVLDWTIRKFITPRLYLDDDLLQLHLRNVRDEKLQVVEDVYYEMKDPRPVRYYRDDSTERVWRSYEDELGDGPQGTTWEIDKEAYTELRRQEYTADKMTPQDYEAFRKILASNPQYATALERLGVIPPTKINAKGKVAFAFAKTDPEHKALLEHPDTKVQALVAARIGVKTTIEETRTVSYLDVATRGAWPVAYSYSGAWNTHRFSGNKGGGGNPMNLPRGGQIRKAIMADEGYVCLVLDMSQIECRLALWFGTLSSKTKGMEAEALELMREGDRLRLQGLDDSESDLYSYFAGMMFGRKINKRTDPNERQIGKSGVLGLGFGMGAVRFQEYCAINGAKGVDAKLAEATKNLYRNTYTGVKAMWRTFEQAMKAAVERGEEWTIGPLSVCKDPIFGAWSYKTEGGLLLKYPDLGWDAENEGTYRDGNKRVKIFGGKFYENGIQHVARNILTEGLMRIQKRYEVVMTTYDEVVLLVEDNPQKIQVAIEFARKELTKEHPMFPGLPLGVEWGFHKRYGMAKG